jgi:(p)ppGpp synthase/HD superfamily hydrolase
MSKLNSQQKNYLKSIESDSKRKKLKKAFKKVNKEKELLDSKILLTKLFKSIDPNKKKNK